MKSILSVVVLLVLSIVTWGQTCTISCPGAPPCSINWNNASPPTCDEGGNANSPGVTTLIISDGVTLNFDSNGDTWTGTEIIVFGEFIQVFTGGNTINANLIIKSGGFVEILNQLLLGSNSPTCDYTIKVEAGGILTVPGGPGADDKLKICGNEIIRSGPMVSCNVYDPDADPPTPIPYCNPDGGFLGPIDFDKDGVQPVELIYFTAKKSLSDIKLSWATSKEENFSHFVVQHAANGVDFSDLTEIRGAGYNTESINRYTYTHAIPLIGHNYYRLKAIDLNGEFEYFGPVVERFNGSKALWINPNPSSAEKVEFKTNFTPEESDRIQVYNQVGLVMADVMVNQLAGVVYFNEPLKPGSYILRYATINETKFARFVVVK